MELLLDAGADVNAVGDDKTIVAGIERQSTPEEGPFIRAVDAEWYWNVEEKYLSEYQISQLIRIRSIQQIYETILRIVETQLHHGDENKQEKLLAMKNMLEEKGGKSLNLYPGQNFPGHLEAYDYHTSMMKGSISYVIN